MKGIKVELFIQKQDIVTNVNIQNRF